MADRKAVNKYYPPDWEPKHGSVNKYHGQHPLRDRARKLDQGILIIRFEMPYNVWCDSCEAHIGKGVRFNAEKKQAGTYFSTKIWSFRMKCPHCKHWMEVRTDPENRDYKMVSGVRRKVETWAPEADTAAAHAEELGTLKLNDAETRQKLVADPFFRLEHGADDTYRAKQAAPVLERLQDMRDDRYSDDFGASQMLRKRLRDKKKETKALEEEADKLGLGIPLLPKAEEDLEQARAVQFAKKKISKRSRSTKSQASVFHGHTMLTGAKTQRHSALEKAKRLGMDPSMLSMAKHSGNRSSLGVAFGGAPPSSAGLSVSVSVRPVAK
mmetsp:Transcript_15883/g.62054  ORF Transcript_15883/g.62054 Transcript_15883/m.62054 type:complete len:325 (-) Transcript_15883:67-1041(-)